MFSRCFVQGLRRTRFAPPTLARPVARAQTAANNNTTTPRWTPMPSIGRRTYASTVDDEPKTADEWMEQINDLYGTARDEFEIAMEETEKVTVYAQSDRDAAREALDDLKTAVELVVNGRDRGVGEEVKRRVGGRIRELENAVKSMEELAVNQD